MARQERPAPNWEEWPFHKAWWSQSKDACRDEESDDVSNIGPLDEDEAEPWRPCFAWEPGVLTAFTITNDLNGDRPGNISIPATALGNTR